MKKQIQIFTANAAGNVTIFVNSAFERSEYSKVANQLLDMKELGGEQVAFMMRSDKEGVDGKMEMCGLEFCGNASRSFGLLLAKMKRANGPARVMVEVSGCDEPLMVQADTITSWAKIQMPDYEEIKQLDLSGLDLEDIYGDAEALKSVDMVDFGGIAHIIVKDVKATEENFRKIKEYIYGSMDMPALGVMFFDVKEHELTPVVYVKDVDSTYFEGSCGSGTTACAIAFSKNKLPGRYPQRFRQPAGSIDTIVEVKKGRVEKVFIESTVVLSDPIKVEIDV